MQTPPAPLAGLSAIAQHYDVILSDIWGVVHNGKAAFTDACAALTRFRKGGGTVVLITNAPRPNAPVLEQLAHLKVPLSAFDDIVTSGDVTLELIAAHGAAPVHHIGPERDLSLFDTLARMPGARCPPMTPLREAKYVVVTGLFNDFVDTPDDYVPALMEMRARNMPMICANPDIVVHVGAKLLYCAGAIAQRYAEMGGAPVCAGKPFSPIYERALALAGAHRGGPAAKARVLAIGDALATDIAGAAEQGIEALMVTDGIHRDELHGAGGSFDEAAFARLAAEAKLPPPRWRMRSLAW
jgi:HAD superfamily hydrolase (TIGR01459 family)